MKLSFLSIKTGTVRSKYGMKYSFTRYGLSDKYIFSSLHHPLLEYWPPWCKWISQTLARPPYPNVLQNCTPTSRTSCNEICIVFSLKITSNSDTELAAKLLCKLALTSPAISATLTVFSSRTRYGPYSSRFAFLSHFYHHSPSIYAFPYGSTLSRFLFITCTVFVIRVYLLHKVL